MFGERRWWSRYVTPFVSGSSSATSLQFTVGLGVILIACLIQPSKSCQHVFTSARSPTGIFNSPDYPNFYPPHVHCRYIFDGTKDERIKIEFDDFDLELGTDAGCLFDYIDVFTIDTDNMMNLEDRLCGERKPNPIVSVHRRLELVFKSDYARSRRGFKGRYHFLDELWSSFPEDSRGCGEKYLGGAGGEITSPGYPAPYPGDVKCMWMIKVDHDMTIVLNFLELDLGPSVHCTTTYVAIYNGFAHPGREATTKLCKQTPDNKEFKSKTFRVVLRFQTALTNEFTSKGFRVVWTAVWVPHTSHSAKGGVVADRCDEFHCRGEEYCIDTSKVLCNPLPRYCISKSLRCNGVANCGANDSSDEEGCFTKAMLMASAAIGGCVAAIVAIATAMVLWKRRRTAVFVRDKKMQRQPDGDYKTSQERRNGSGTRSHHQLTELNTVLDYRPSLSSHRSPSSRRSSFVRATAIDCCDLDAVPSSMSTGNRKERLVDPDEVTVNAALVRSGSMTNATTSTVRGNGSLKVPTVGRSRSFARSMPSTVVVFDGRNEAAYRPLNDFLYEFSCVDGVKTEHVMGYGAEDDDDEHDGMIEVDRVNSKSSTTTTQTDGSRRSNVVRRHSSSGRIRCKARTGRQKQHEQLIDHQRATSTFFDGCSNGVVECDANSWNSVVASATHAVTPTRTDGGGVFLSDVDDTWNVGSYRRRSAASTNGKQQQRWMSYDVVYDQTGSPRTSAVSSTSTGSKWSTTLGPVPPSTQLQQHHHHQQQQQYRHHVDRDNFVGSRQAMNRSSYVLGRAGNGPNGQPESTRNASSVV